MLQQEKGQHRRWIHLVSPKIPVQIVQIQDTTPTNKQNVMNTAGILRLFISIVIRTWLVTLTEGMFVAPKMFYKIIKVSS